MRNTVFSLSICLVSYAIPIAAHATDHCSETDRISLRAAKVIADQTNAAAGNELAGRRIMVANIGDKIHITHLPTGNPNIPSGRGEHVWTKAELVKANSLESQLMAKGRAESQAAAGLTITSDEHRAMVDGSCVVIDGVSRGRTKDGAEVLKLDHVVEEIKGGKIVTITHYIPTKDTDETVLAPSASSEELKTRMRAMLNDPQSGRK